MADGDDTRGPDAAGVTAPWSAPWHEALDAHCERFLGPCPSALGEIVPTSEFKITLYPHRPSAGRPWLTLRTAGVSDHPMVVPKGREDRRRCELLTYLPPDWELDGARGVWWPGAMLRMLGQFVHENSTWFAAGHTVLVAEPGETYAPGTLVTAALLRPATVEPTEFSQFDAGGTQCRFLWVFPITEAETNLKLEHGVGALRALIEAPALSHVLDPGRACLVTGRRP